MGQVDTETFLTFLATPAQGIRFDALAGNHRPCHLLVGYSWEDRPKRTPRLAPRLLIRRGMFALYAAPDRYPIPQPT